MGGFSDDAGTYAVYLLVTGFLYVILRQTVVRNFLLKMGIERKKYTKNLMRSLQFHTLILLLSLVFGTYHGVAMIFDEGLTDTDSLTGILPLLLMAYFSGTGIVLWRRLPKEWFSRDLRRRARLLHSQRLALIVLFVTLAVHLITVV